MKYTELKFKAEAFEDLERTINHMIECAEADMVEYEERIREGSDWYEDIMAKQRYKVEALHGLKKALDKLF